MNTSADNNPSILANHLAAVKTHWANLNENGWTNDSLGSLYDAVHELADSSGEQERFQLNECALSLEVYLSSFIDTDRIPSASQMMEMSELIEALSSAGADLPAPSEGGGSMSSLDTMLLTSGLIYCLHREGEERAALVEELGKRKCEQRAFSDPQALVAAMREELPAAVVVETELLPMITPLTNELERVRSGKQLHVPLAFIGTNNELPSRIQAMRAGAKMYFAPPLDYPGIADQLVDLATPGSAEQHKVLVVEDDPPQAEFAASILRKAGMETRTVTQPLQLMDVLREFRPDLILMDIYMPDANGMELTSIVREDPDFIATPIVFLSGEQSPDKQLDALSMGGDDFISKPIRPRHLIAIVQNRIRRAQEMRRAVGLLPPLAANEESSQAPGPAATESAGSEPAAVATIEPQAEEEASANELLAKALDKALSEDELLCRYQPALDLHERERDNYCLSIHLPREKEASLERSELLEAAGEAGLLQRLDRWALEHAMVALDQSRSEGKQVNLFVDQSSASLGDEGQADWVMSQLRQRQLVGSGLVLAFQLGDLTQHLKPARKYFSALQEMGIKVCLSNFPSKEAAFKILEFLNVDFLQVSDKMLQLENEGISPFVAKAHRMKVRVMVPQIDDPREINLYWTTEADLIMGDFISPSSETMDFDFNQATL